MKWPLVTAPTSRSAWRTWASSRMAGLAAPRAAALFSEDLWGFGTMARPYLSTGHPPGKPGPGTCSTRRRTPAPRSSVRHALLALVLVLVFEVLGGQVAPRDGVEPVEDALLEGDREAHDVGGGRVRPGDGGEEVAVVDERLLLLGPDDVDEASQCLLRQQGGKDGLQQERGPDQVGARVPLEPGQEGLPSPIGDGVRRAPAGADLPEFHEARRRQRVQLPVDLATGDVPEMADAHFHSRHDLPAAHGTPVQEPEQRSRCRIDGWGPLTVHC